MFAFMAEAICLLNSSGLNDVDVKYKVATFNI